MRLGGLDAARALHRLMMSTRVRKGPVCENRQLTALVKGLFQTEKADKPFLVSATLIFVFALLIVAWDFVYLQGMVYRLNVVAAAGLVLFVTGVMIRAVGKRTLGRYYSYGLKIASDHKLVTHGIYRHVRHPITLAAVIYDAGIPLIFSSLYGFLLMLCLIPLFLYRIRVEEKMLVERFGDEYREYVRRTKRLVPFIY